MSKEQPEALQLPTLPFAVFDELGQPCEDRVRDHFAAAFEALRAQIEQSVPVGRVAWAADVPNTIKEIRWSKFAPPVDTLLYTLKGIK